MCIQSQIDTEVEMLAPAKSYGKHAGAGALKMIPPQLQPAA